MKKTLIAGAASLAIAAMPIVGVFAVDDPSDIVDTLNITVESSCAWTRTFSNEGTGVTDSGSTLSATMTAGQTLSGFATSTLNVKCNNSAGYTIKATTTNLVGYKEAAHTTTNGDSIDYAASLAAGKWTAAYNSTAIVSGSTMATASAADDMSTGTNYAVTYGVQTKANQSAGYYTGTITYELDQQ